MGDSLGERSKARRRDAILTAAHELFAERGFDATSIADIAEAAEVSPRTVTLYFPSKLELAMAHFNAFVDELARTPHARPEGQGILDTVEKWLREQAASRSEFDRLHDRMLQTDPQLKGLCRGRLTEVVQDVRPAPGRRAGPAARRLRPAHPGGHGGERDRRADAPVRAGRPGDGHGLHPRRGRHPVHGLTRSRRPRPRRGRAPHGRRRPVRRMPPTAGGSPPGRIPGGSSYSGTFGW
ncbi:TetR family transcriptional regulator [Streptomyces sp. SID89]|nr:TetR family transcriptional regulator [Streptomyces sp. SID89]